jgi:FkbM family methyltransferase
LTDKTMTFTSYAQNLEDVLLWRALRDVDTGFYIDVGANDPEEDSVTKAFYDRGWHGINIEPLPEHHQQLCRERPRDINLAIAAGAASGVLTIYDVPAVRGWASPNETVARAHQDSGLQVTPLTVPVQTLAEVCEQHVRGEIHFLKVDVEGFEAEVVRGMDFQRWRPWVLVIEATMPNSQVTNHAQWEPMIVQHGYRFVYFDGLNRYYVAAEHGELAARLTLQPNVFDEFQSAKLVKALDSARHANNRAKQESIRAQAMAKMASENKLDTIVEARIRDAEEQALTARDALAAAKAQIEKLQLQFDMTDRRLHAVLDSTSWKLTAPLRRLGTAAHIVAGLGGAALRSPRALPRRVVLGLTRRLLPVIKSSPALRNAAWRLYSKFPGPAERLRRALRPAPALEATQEVAVLTQSVPGVWAEVSLANRFKEALLRELKQGRDCNN